jgi:hypothetical protein
LWQSADGKRNSTLVDDHTITDCGSVDKRSENELAINADA